ncbi:16S rRNA processing protein RimM [bacterium]|nr:16S rRNA processing protein RimM [bacterium]
MIGQLGKSHGLKGEMRCRPETDFPERFLDTKEVEIFLKNEPARRVTVESARFHGSHILLKLSGIDSPEQAAQLTNYMVAVGPDEVVDMEDGFYHYELEGLEVFEPDGTLIGVLQEVIDNPAHEIYRVGDVLIPAVDEYILEIDLEAGRMVARRPVYDED